MPNSCVIEILNVGLLIFHVPLLAFPRFYFCCPVIFAAATTLPITKSEITLVCTLPVHSQTHSRKCVTANNVDILISSLWLYKPLLLQPSHVIIKCFVCKQQPFIRAGDSTIIYQFPTGTGQFMHGHHSDKLLLC